ncbi:MAG: histidinol dehydrogenase [Deltaproteobacteria bacterium]|nr:histidinol dehydrogenase [Deltaproteobacteria bacterium]
MASRSTAKLLRVLKTDESGFDRAWSTICARRESAGQNVEKQAAAIISRVREGDDAELFACVKEFDGADLESLEVGRDEWDAACELVDPGDRAAIGKAAMRVRDFHRKRIPSSWEMREEGGAYMGVRVRPLERVGIYVPGGKAVYPSSVIMNAVPASVVEVPEIIMATPPEADGSIRPEVLMAARVAGVHRIFKMGGAQAVAAMAYGTASVPRVDKITGPGNIWVATAKRLVFGDVGIDAEAGPTEVCIVADTSATPAWLAADLISQAEHDELAQAVLITNSKGIATRVQSALTKQIKDLERADIARESLTKRGAIVVTRNINESMDLANEYGGEHLVLAVKDAELMHKRVVNAGAVFLGHYTPVAVGDYIAGPNHVLPTGGTARFFSPLGVDDFLKRTSFVRFEPPKLRELGAEVIRLAEVEGLTGHGRSVDLRLQKIRRARREREAAREAEAEL